MRQRPLSLQARLLIAASLALAAFLGLTGVALENAFQQSALTSTRDRLQSYIYAYLAGSDINIAGRLIIPEVAPEPRFDRPASGLYAGVRGEELDWVSGSAIGRELPFRDDLAPGELDFSGPLEADVGGVYVLSYGVAWEMADGGEVLFTFNVAEHQSNLNRQFRAFRRTLWRWLGGVGVILLLVQLTVLRWSLNPLRQVAQELGEVESGRADSIQGDYPAELTRLTSRLNEFIVSERESLHRHRRTLADLAHSLKTPLAVVRSRLEGGGSDSRDDVMEQVERMDGIVAYQLKRAATAGHVMFLAPLSIEATAEDIVRTLEKVHADKGVLCEFDLEPGAAFYGERGDLMELLGNLLENAFKWSQRRVLLSSRSITTSGCRRPGIELSVEDDGPGIPDDHVERLLQRGVRGDERVAGHGIGLSIVQDIVNDFKAELSVTRSELGGACFRIRFPCLT